MEKVAQNQTDEKSMDLSVDVEYGDDILYHHLCDDKHVRQAIKEKSDRRAACAAY